VLRMTAKEFYDEITAISNEITAFLQKLMQTK
jgi:hypothetical protein